MFRIGDKLFDEKDNTIKIIFDKGRQKFLLLNVKDDEIIGELYCEQIIYADGETYIS